MLRMNNQITPSRNSATAKFKLTQLVCPLRALPPSTRPYRTVPYRPTARTTSSSVGTLPAASLGYVNTLKSLFTAHPNIVFLLRQPLYCIQMSEKSALESDSRAGGRRETGLGTPVGWSLCRDFRLHWGRLDWDRGTYG